MKKQIVLIHGGTTFNTYKDYLSSLNKKKVDLDRYRQVKWSDSLPEDLGGTIPSK